MCVGCSAGHASDALILYGEAVKFERARDHKMRDLHLAKFFGQIREAEEQNPFPETREQIRGIRKTVESTVASNSPLPDIADKLTAKAAEIIGQLREHPELCRSCSLPKTVPEVEHV